MLRQLGAIFAIFELSDGDLAGFFEVAVFVKKLVDLVLDLGLKVEFFHKPGNVFTDFARLALTLDNFFLDSLLDGPKSVAIFDILKDKFTFLAI